MTVESAQIGTASASALGAMSARSSATGTTSTDSPSSSASLSRRSTIGTSPWGTSKSTSRSISLLVSPITPGRQNPRTSRAPQSVAREHPFDFKQICAYHQQRCLQAPSDGPPDLAKKERAVALLRHHDPVAPAESKTDHPARPPWSPPTLTTPNMVRQRPYVSLNSTQAQCLNSPGSRSVDPGPPFVESSHGWIRGIPDSACNEQRPEGRCLLSDSVSVSLVETGQGKNHSCSVAVTVSGVAAFRARKCALG